MKRFFCLAFLLLWSLPAFAQLPLTGAGKGAPGGGGGGSPTIVPGAAVAPQSVAFSGTPVSFSGLNGGVNFPSGAVVFVGFGNDQGTIPATPLIGGQTATLVTGASDSANKCLTYTATMVGSQPDTFSTASAFTYDRVAVSSVYFTNITATPTGTGNETYAGGPPGNTGSDPQFASVLSPTATIPATGFGWAWVFALSFTILTGNTVTWQTTTPSFITSGSGDTSPLLNAKAQTAAAHTTAALAGASSWQGKVSASPQAFSFVSCVGAIAVGP